MNIIADINQKGGVGKTTTATNLACAIASEGEETLLIDLDAQANTTNLILPPDFKLRASIGDVLKTPETIRAAIHETPIDKLSIIGSTLKLALDSENLSSKYHREKMLFKALKILEGTKELKSENPYYRHVVIDCPPSLGVLTINAIYAATHFLIPTNYSRFALDGIGDLLDVITQVKETRDFKYSVVRNCYDSRTNKANQFVDSQLEGFKNNLLKTVIRKTESINRSQINGETIFSFDPKGKGSEDFVALWGELKARMENKDV